MRIEKVSENKIKIMIDGQEAEKMNLSFRSISDNTPEAQYLLRIAIKMAEENVNFSVGSAKLFVEAVRDEDWDGFGMMITKVSNEEQLNQAINSCHYRGVLKRRSLMTFTETVAEKIVFVFSDFENACMAADEIRNIFWGSSSLYKYQSRFYLELSPEKKDDFLKIEMMLSEFGGKVENSRYMMGRLQEYGERMIAQNALEIMQEYFPVYDLNR